MQQLFMKNMRLNILPEEKETMKKYVEILYEVPSSRLFVQKEERVITVSHGLVFEASDVRYGRSECRFETVWQAGDQISIEFTNLQQHYTYPQID